MLSLEWNPSSSLHFYLDALDAKKTNDMQRVDMNWVGRNGAMIPINMQVDRTDCSNGCVVTQATYANAQFFLEFRPYTEETTLWSVNPGFEWSINKDLKADGMLYDTKSKFTRESPTVGPVTAASSGVTVNFVNGTVPSITTNIDLNNPANFVWNGGRVNLQMEKRETDTKGGTHQLHVGTEVLQRAGRLRVRRHFAHDQRVRQLRRMAGGRVR